MQRVPKATPPDLDLSDYEWFTLRTQTMDDGRISVAEGRPFLTKQDTALGMRALAQAEAKRKGSPATIYLYVFRSDPADSWSPSWMPLA